MSQIELEPIGSATTKKPNLAEFSPQTLYDKCLALARNLWWSWHPEVINLFRDLDPIRWRQFDHNPIALLAEFTPERLEMRAAEMVLYSRINQAYRRLKEYMADTHDLGHAPTPACWARSRWPISRPSSACTNRCRSIPAAWACSRATISRAPAAWACRWWPSGCFTTRAISSSISIIDGYQHEEYLDTKVENLPMEPALGADGKPITVAIDTRTGQLLAKVWLMHVGRVQLVSARLRRRRQQPGRSRADQPAVRRRQPHPHPPGAGAGRRRRQGADGAGHHAGRLSPERRAQRVRHARSHSRADERRRP